jgi:hypothetical protein
MALTPGTNLNSVAAPQAVTLAQITLTSPTRTLPVGLNNIYQTLWRKRLKFLDHEQFQDSFHK